MADDDAEASAHQEEEEKLTEGAKEALKEELKDFLRELTKFTLWVLALTFVALSSRNNVQMHNAALFLRMNKKLFATNLANWGKLIIFFILYSYRRIESNLS